MSSVVFFWRRINPRENNTLLLNYYHYYYYYYYYYPNKKATLNQTRIITYQSISTQVLDSIPYSTLLQHHFPLWGSWIRLDLWMEEHF